MDNPYDAPDPDIRWVLAIVGAAVLVLTGAIMLAAVWKSSFYYGVLPMGVLAVIFGLQVALLSLPAARVPAEAAVRTCPGPGLSADGLDQPSGLLLRRAREAIAAVTSSAVCRAGLLDRAAVSTALAGQEADIAAALRDQARIRARRAELTPARPGPRTTAVLDSQVHAAQQAAASTAARVQALERYAAEVADADAAYRDWRQAARAAELHGQHLDLVARTAADDHGIAGIQAMARHARAVSLALREPPA